MMAGIVENGFVPDQSPKASNEATMLFSALSSPSDITVRCRYDGGYFDLRRLKAKTKVLEALMRDFLFADDCVLAALNERDFQELASCMSIAAKAFWLHHSQTSRSMAQKLNNVGSTVTSTCRMDKEVSNRLEKASVSFGSLWTRVSGELGITVRTKMQVYKAVVIISLLYGCETWTLYRNQLNTLDQFHLR